MKHINKSVCVPYTAAQMFSLVDAIEAYPEFLPACQSTVVHSRTSDEVKASLYFMRGSISQSFTTLNHFIQNKQIEMRLIQGPFSHLEGVWRFEAMSEAECRVSFDLALEFSSKLIALTVGPVLQKGIESYIEAFCARAKAIYGS